MNTCDVLKAEGQVGREVDQSSLSDFPGKADALVLGALTELPPTDAKRMQVSPTFQKFLLHPITFRKGLL